MFRSLARRARLSSKQCRLSSSRLSSSSASASASVSSLPHREYTTSLGAFHLPTMKNEPMLNYAPGSIERKHLEAAIKKLKSTVTDVPIIINGKEIRSGKKGKQVMPSNHNHVLASFYETDGALTHEAIDGALKAKIAWENMPQHERSTILLKAADLLSSKYRYDVLAATILGQGKNAWQAEIDAAAEAADFFRFNTQYVQQMYAMQPNEHSQYVWNRMEYRPLEGFVYAVSPFNFTAIGANLCTSPALVGNVVIWKPSSTAILSNYLMYKILVEAGMPPGVIQFLPGEGPAISDVVFAHKEFAGLHFTGSTRTFQSMWKTIGERIHTYRSYPRIVGETGGKNFHFIHESADVTNVINQTLRSAFEYSGQKCSACSRMYVPDTLWPEIKKGLVDGTKKIIANQFGASEDFNTFVSAVIDEKAFHRIKSYIDNAKQSSDIEVLAGGVTDMSTGYYVQPTILLTKNPNYVTMREEIFGPVLTIYVYPAAQYEETMQLCDRTTDYALTGSIFATDRMALDRAHYHLRHSAGNFYVNDKSTGAVVGQQAFGGGRGSGTNDKAGALQNLVRWTSPRTIKETFIGITDYGYPHLKKE